MENDGQEGRTKNITFIFLSCIYHIRVLVFFRVLPVFCGLSTVLSYCRDIASRYRLGSTACPRRRLSPSTTGSCAGRWPQAASQMLQHSQQRSSDGHSSKGHHSDSHRLREYRSRMVICRRARCSLPNWFMAHPFRKHPRRPIVFRLVIRFQSPVGWHRWRPLREGR